MRLALALATGMALWLGWLLLTHEGDGGRRLWDREERVFTPLILPDERGPDAKFFAGIYQRIMPGPQGVARDHLQIRLEADRAVAYACSDPELGQVLGKDLRCQYATTRGNLPELVCVAGGQAWVHLRSVEAAICPET